MSSPPATAAAADDDDDDGGGGGGDGGDDDDDDDGDDDNDADDDDNNEEDDGDDDDEEEEDDGDAPYSIDELIHVACGANSDDVDQVCDEGHRLKAAGGSKTIEALESLNCSRRILLTGTPIQNSLDEFYGRLCLISSTVSRGGGRVVLDPA